MNIIMRTLKCKVGYSRAKAQIDKNVAIYYKGLLVINIGLWGFILI